MTPQEDLPRLDVADVSVAYPNGHLALHDASFQLRGGTICALVGVNGSGKSTLFKSIMGFVTPRTGSVKINGLPVRAVLKQHLVAYVPQAEEVDWQFPVSVWDVTMINGVRSLGFTTHESGQETHFNKSPAKIGVRAFFSGGAPGDPISIPGSGSQRDGPWRWREAGVWGRHVSGRIARGFTGYPAQAPPTTSRSRTSDDSSTGLRPIRGDQRSTLFTA